MPPGKFPPDPLTAALAAGDAATFARVAEALQLCGGHVGRAAEELRTGPWTLRRCLGAHPQLQRVQDAAVGRRSALEVLLACLPPGAHLIPVTVSDPLGDPDGPAECVRRYCAGEQADGQNHATFAGV